VSRRFRTKGIRKEAEACVEDLAERKGWTVEELADRTIPFAGFVDGPVMELDFGPRKFTATLDDQMEMVLKNEDGKPIKNLPAPAKSDDAEKAKEAKKEFSAAKLELKQVVKITAERFYEAMCTQRQWRYEDWAAYLLGHPVVRYLCRRVIWVVMEGQKPVAWFRPLPDGTLTSHEDQELRLMPDAVVMLAHSVNTTEKVIAAWRQHFADYEVEPLFDQFSRPLHQLLEEKINNSSLDDFQGHLIEYRALRNTAQKLGFNRGPTEDGGWFYTFVKKYPGLKLEVILEFTGVQIMEDDETVAILSLTFNEVESDGREEYRNAIPLKQVPAILLSETYHDLKAIAAKGSGYDKDWRSKTRQ
jgi:hypothetical protein